MGQLPRISLPSMPFLKGSIPWTRELESAKQSEIGNWILFCPSILGSLRDMHSLTYPLCWSGSHVRKAAAVSNTSPLRAHNITVLSSAAVGLWENQVEQDKFLNISTLGSGVRVAVSALLWPGWDFEVHLGLFPVRSKTQQCPQPSASPKL